MTENSVRGEKADKGDHLQLELQISEEDYMKNRVVFKIKIYDKLSKRHRNRYYLFSVLSIIFAATVPVLINLDLGTVALIVATFLSLAVTILVSLEKLFHFREHWKNYDMMAWVLRREQLYFQTKTGPYDEGKQEKNQAFALFVKNVEEAIKNEREETIEMRTQEMA